MREEQLELTFLIVLREAAAEMRRVTTPPVRFLENGEEFRALTDGDFNGFYDLLRTKDLKVIGLRLSLFEDFDETATAISHLDYVECLLTTTGHRILNIFFSEKREFVESKSNDEWFGDNYLYLSDFGTYAITFAVPNGTELDVRHISTVA